MSYRGDTIERQPIRLGKHIRLLGYVPDEDLPGPVRLGRLLRFPDAGRGLWYAHSGAMASGIPVLTSRPVPLLK